MRYRAFSRRHRAGIIVLAFSILVTAPCLKLSAQTPQTSRSTMHHYAMIFRATRSLSDAELKQRSAEIQTWVAKVQQMDIQLDPRNLGDVVGAFAIDAGKLNTEGSAKDPSFGTIVFFDAADDATATEIAKEHPGLRYGVTLELRRWAAPQPLAPQVVR